MPANSESSALVTGLENVSFHPMPKEGQSQRMFKPLNNCVYFTYKQGYTQNASKFGKLSSGFKTGKGQFSFQSQSKALPKMLKPQHNLTHLTC